MRVFLPRILIFLRVTTSYDKLRQVTTMGNVCTQRVKPVLHDRFPSDYNVRHEDIPDYIEDGILMDYIKGNHELVDRLTTAGSSFLVKKSTSSITKDSKSSPESEAQAPPQLMPLIPRFLMPTPDSMPTLSSRKTSDSIFFSKREHFKTASICSDSDAESRVSSESLHDSDNLIDEINTPPSYRNAKFFCSPLSPTHFIPNMPPTPRVRKTFWTNNTFASMDSTDNSNESGSSQGSEDSQGTPSTTTFDPTQWIWEPQSKN